MNLYHSAEKPEKLIPALKKSDSLVTARISGRLVGIGNAIIGDPTNPNLLNVEDRLSGDDIQFSGAYLYMRGDRTFCVFDITDPAYPIAIGCVAKGNYFLGTRITSTSVSEHYAYICDDEDGLSVVDLNACGLK